MNDTIKKLVLFGVGSLELTKEAVSKFMKDLEKEGALDRSEGKKIVQKTFKELDQNLKKFQKGVEKEMTKWEKEHKNKEQIMAKEEVTPKAKKTKATAKKKSSSNAAPKKTKILKET